MGWGVGTPAEGGNTWSWCEGASGDRQSGWRPPIRSTSQCHRFSSPLPLSACSTKWEILKLRVCVGTSNCVFSSLGCSGFGYYSPRKGSRSWRISHATLAFAFNMIQKPTKIHSVHGNRGAMLLFPLCSFSMSCFFFSPHIIDLARRFIGLNQVFLTRALLISGLANPLWGCRRSLCPLGCFVSPWL